MKNISKVTFENDLKIIDDMFKKYSDAIYEKQDGQVDHYDNQPKLIKLALEDVRCGLTIVKYALTMLTDVKENLIESCL